jgi:predicted enzyme involved in methoxymalonyl-ACP biosynthesis
MSLNLFIKNNAAEKIHKKRVSILQKKSAQFNLRMKTWQ